jgi:two-component system osmolarity sensor histidine kinase EnvZ
MAVRRAVANLIDNALRYAGEPVEMEALARGPEVSIEVRDQGPGIPPNEVERLKRPFTRLDDSRSGHGGSGLGLAIVERTALAHGGRLELLPCAPRGLIARLSLATQ